MARLGGDFSKSIVLSGCWISEFRVRKPSQCEANISRFQHKQTNVNKHVSSEYLGPCTYVPLAPHPPPSLHTPPISAEEGGGGESYRRIDVGIIAQEAFAVFAREELRSRQGEAGEGVALEEGEGGKAKEE